MEAVELTGGHKKIVVLGEQGSGKSELAINLSLKIHRESRDKVCFFDMDQTKPMFRSREASKIMAAAGISFFVEDQFMDAPTVPPGIKESLADRDTWTILDVGGGIRGACCMGQFAESIAAADALVLYVINPYRCFSETTEQIYETLKMICRYSGMEKVHIVCNPFLGKSTTGEQIVNGHDRLQSLIEPLGFGIFWNAIPDCLWNEVYTLLPENSIRITSYLSQIPG